MGFGHGQGKGIPTETGSAEDVLVEALGEVVVAGVVVKEEMGEDVTGHTLVERLLFVDWDMISQRQAKKIRKALMQETTTQRKNEGRTTLSAMWFQIAATMRSHDLHELVHVCMRPLIAKQTAPS